MEIKIKMHTQKLEKVGKVTFKVIEEYPSIIDQQQYKNIVCDDTLKWFRRLGGTESVTREYTSRGYNVVKLVSTCPNKELRTIRTFDFE
jgi:hypothetical protein